MPHVYRSPSTFAAIKLSSSRVRFGLHQDFAFVHAKILSHLIGAWAACEEAGPENGTFLYYPGSHRLPPFDFGDGSVIYRSDDPKMLDRFEQYLNDACANEKPVLLHVKKGDVLLWHGALVHGGAPTKNRALTRRSFVTHYSTQRAYLRDRRIPKKKPKVITRSGGQYHGWQFSDHIEGRYKL